MLSSEQIELKMRCRYCASERSEERPAGGIGCQLSLEPDTGRRKVPLSRKRVASLGVITSTGISQLKLALEAGEVTGNILTIITPTAPASAACCTVFQKGTAPLERVTLSVSLDTSTMLPRSSRAFSILESAKHGTAPTTRSSAVEEVHSDGRGAEMSANVPPITSGGLPTHVHQATAAQTARPS